MRELGHGREWRACLGLHLPLPRIELPVLNVGQHGDRGELHVDRVKVGVRETGTGDAPGNVVVLRRDAAEPANAEPEQHPIEHDAEHVAHDGVQRAEHDAERHEQHGAHERHHKAPNDAEQQPAHEAHDRPRARLAARVQQVVEHEVHEVDDDGGERHPDPERGGEQQRANDGDDGDDGIADADKDQQRRQANEVVEDDVEDARDLLAKERAIGPLLKVAAAVAYQAANVA